MYVNQKALISFSQSDIISKKKININCKYISIRFIHICGCDIKKIKLFDTKRFIIETHVSCESSADTQIKSALKLPVVSTVK